MTPGSLILINRILIGRYAFICLKGEKQEVTKTLNWATDWPVLIEGEQRESEVGKSRAQGGTKGNGSAADGNATTLLYSVRCCSN